MFEEIRGRLFHFVTKGNEVTLKEYGLCSPRKLYEVDKNLFMTTTYENYKYDASERLMKPVLDITMEDILSYLDKRRRRAPYLTSRTIFGTFLPYHWHGTAFRNNLNSPLHEVSLFVEYLEDKVLLIIKGDRILPVTWKQIQQMNFIEKIREEAKMNLEDFEKKPTNAFNHLTFWAIPDLYHIPYVAFADMKQIGKIQRNIMTPKF